MKIGLLGTAADRVGEIPAELAACVGSSTTLAMYPVRIALFAHGPAELAIQQVNYLEAGLRAAEDGCDAVVCVSTADYAVSVLRDLFAIPVVGAGEAAYAMARSLGERFSLVTVWPPSTNFIHHRNMRRYGMTERLAGIRNVMEETALDSDTRPDQFIAEMQGGDPDTFARILTACHLAEAEDGTDLLVLGCTCMSPIAAQIARNCRTPVVNPFVAAVRLAETLGPTGQGSHDPLAVRPQTLALLDAMTTFVGGE